MAEPPVVAVELLGPILGILDVAGRRNDEAILDDLAVRPLGGHDGEGNLDVQVLLDPLRPFNVGEDLVDNMPMSLIPSSRIRP